jgi:hypothetical protein
MDLFSFLLLERILITLIEQVLKDFFLDGYNISTLGSEIISPICVIRVQFEKNLNVYSQKCGKYKKHKFFKLFPIKLTNLVSWSYLISRILCLMSYVLYLKSKLNRNLG